VRLFLWRRSYRIPEPISPTRSRKHTRIGWSPAVTKWRTALHS